MGLVERLARRAYRPLTSRLDGVLWRLDAFERHRVDDEERNRRALEAGGAQISTGLSEVSASSRQQ